MPEKNKCGENCNVCSGKSIVYSLLNYVGLALIKWYVGCISGSRALIADAMQSSSDAVNTIFGMIAMKIARKPPDRSHPYGHGKIEFVIGMLVGAVILYTSFRIICSSAGIILSGKQIRIPHIAALVVPIISIYSNYIVSRLTFCAVEHSNSPVLKVISNNNTSDIYASVITLIALIGTQFGYAFLDPLAGIIIGLLLLKNSAQIVSENYRSLLDSGIDNYTMEKINAIISLFPDVKSAKYIKARKVGAKIWVDVCICLFKEKTIEESDKISRAIRNSIMSRIPNLVEDVQVCVKPL